MILLQSSIQKIEIFPNNLIVGSLEESLSSSRYLKLLKPNRNT